ncbi:hypothetical protein CDD81_509 [Ophiocordyceps australis]|uniref:DNA repair protein REV1 n=1 Tax=Ophiocordyceps australis TaxID=1399860 RepID=A0A2C5X8I8_9HYPO|nr:hypothetical protein CDD81_509 [Ophiocordyceps australis]
MGSVLDKNSAKVRKRIESHVFDNEDGQEYEASSFNGFGDYFRRKKIKLQNLDSVMRACSGKPQIFKGIVAHVTGYTQPSLQVLHREIVEHGGGFLQYLDGKTMATHIIASALPPKKTIDFGRYRIVKPAWIVESIQAGRLLPWSDFRLLDQGPRQKVLTLDSSKTLTQANPQPKKGYREQSDNSFYTNELKATTTLPSQNMSQLAEKLPNKGLASRGQYYPFEPEDKAAMTEPASKTLESQAHGKGGSPAPSSVEKQQPTVTTKPPNKVAKEMTSEEHNSLLLSDSRLRKSSTANPNFLKQYYSESRLHHLSTWKASLKASMQRMAAEQGSLHNKPKRRPEARAYIMHVDFDSFFCAVSLKRHPELARKPAVVAHGPGPGSEIASCNYPAREFGIKNGMWMKRALELCPDIQVMSYDFPAYEEASRQFYECILSVGGIVQSVSVDEALIDATAEVLSAAGSQGIGVDEGSIWREQDAADEMARRLREQIKVKTGCAVSIGIGANILQAKVALRRGKPDGQYQLKPDEVLEVIGDLKVEDLPGVSHSIGGKLEELGIRFVKDIRSASRERLASALGPKTGEKLAEYARGIDSAQVGEQPPRKSVSAEVNWGIRFVSQQEAEEFVLNLCKELEKRMLAEQVKGKHFTVKIMRRSLDAPLDPAKHLGHGKCDTFTRSTAFGVATHNGQSVAKEAVGILRSFKFSPGDIRGLGVQMTKLEAIKTNTSAPQGSQRTLNFGPFVGPSPLRRQAKPEAIEDDESPSKTVSSEGRILDHDPITEDPLTPRKPKMHPAMALSRAAQQDAKSNTPLNVSGTQFIMPTNPDQSVLAELPSDIRRKLTAQQPKEASPLARRAAQQTSMADLLSSQVDQDVFNALPEDMKAEVLAEYGRKKPEQSPVRQAARKERAPLPRHHTSPSKRRGARKLFGKAQRRRDAQAGVLQTDFRALKHGGQEVLAMDEVEELDPAFLAELPESVRKEVVADHRRRRLAKRSGLGAPMRRYRPSAFENVVPDVEKRVKIPLAPDPVTFANTGLTSTTDVKDMLDVWHGETRERGPHSKDVEVLERYLGRVVLEERDLEKVVIVVRWLRVLVEQDGPEGKGREAWRKAADRVQMAVQEAVRQRGLAPLAF